MAETNSPTQGRPLKFKSVEELQAQIDAYFRDCECHPIQVVEYQWLEIEEVYKDVKGVQKTRTVPDYTQQPTPVTRYRISEKEPYSITGLALALDTSRKVLLEYESGLHDGNPEDENYDPLQVNFSNTIKKAKVRIEHDVQRNLTSNAVIGTIFNLKNNFSWIDSQQNDGTQELIITTRRHGNAKSTD